MPKPGPLWAQPVAENERMRGTFNWTLANGKEKLENLARIIWADHGNVLKAIGEWMKPFVIACLLSVLGLASLGFAPRGEQGAGKITVGVVDMGRILQECKRLHVLLEPYRVEQKKWNDQINALVKERQEKGKAIENFEKGSAEYNNIVLKMKVLEYRISQMDKLAAVQTRQTRANCLLQYYREIEKAVGTIAKTRGLYLVLKTSVKASNKVSPVTRISLRQAEPLLYVDDKVDISGAVIKLLSSMK